MEILDAEHLVEYLMRCGGFWEGTKKQFALAIGWTRGEGLQLDGDVRRVQTACNVTRDQGHWPNIEATLGGYVVDYAPSTGGMFLIDPSDAGGTPPRAIAHFLIGQVRTFATAATQIRRCVPQWHELGVKVGNEGEMELAALCFHCEGELKDSGRLSQERVQQVFHAFDAYGIS